MSRRDFVASLGGAAAAATLGAAQLQAGTGGEGQGLRQRKWRHLGDRPEGWSRAQESYQLRIDAAGEERVVTPPPHLDNGDERLYGNRIGNYSKGLPHNAIGEVTPAAYQAFLRAVASGNPDHWDLIPLGGTTKLTNPQAGLAFDMEGTDSHQLAIPPAPALSSAERAGEMVEDYWMALLRDAPFTNYQGHPLAQCACAELSRLRDFRGPKAQGKVTPGTLFRGFTAGDRKGPYISQFLLKPVDFGALPITQQYITHLPGSDFMTDLDSWLSVQNGQGPFGPNPIDPQHRYLRNGRDLSAWVHVDILFQAYFMACLYLVDSAAPLNPGNPYVDSHNQVGFGTMGVPHVKALLAEVASRALKSVWYQKWFVHRALRPEEYGGLVHVTNHHDARYPLHADALHSEAGDRLYVQNGSWLLPMVFPEGCPTHPSYGQGHGTVAGACVTILKAFFDDTAHLAEIGDGQIVQASEDGLSLLPYLGADAGELTVGGELNKLAANIAIGRNMAGVHWRSDYRESLLLGEALAISILGDQSNCYNEDFDGFTFHKFDGTEITV